MKQLITIAAKHLKTNDLLFDYGTRKCQTIAYVTKDNVSGIGIVSEIYVCYGTNSDIDDNFSPEDKVSILIDTEKIKIIEKKD